MILTDRRQAGKRKEQLSCAKNLVKDRKGTTLVETMVTLFLISILMAMAASALSSASRIFVRIQKIQYAQSVLDTTMTELRTITKDAAGYVKLYERTTAVEEQYGGSKGTNTKGNAIEFMTPRCICIWTISCIRTGAGGIIWRSDCYMVSAFFIKRVTNKNTLKFVWWGSEKLIKR